MLTIDNKDIENMQNKVKLIRQILGISIYECSNLLGVSRQTLYNIENHKKTLTKMQYLAFRMLISLSVKEHPEKKQIISTILIS